MYDAYVYGLSGCALVLGITYVCWKRKLLDDRSVNKKSSHQKDASDVNERKPLLSSQNKGVSKAIDQFESQQAANKKEKSTSSKNNREQNKHKVSSAVRCPVCRKVISSSDTADNKIASFKGQKIHRACFQCFDCQASLHSHDENTVQQHAANVRTKYQCGDCSHKYQGQLQRHHRQSAIQHKTGKVIIDSSEKGNTKETMDAIGDELNEAVYFMHPKCCVCGGKFPVRKRYQQQQKEEAPNPRQMATTIKGNWRYHQECWDTMGKPSWSDELKTYNKLPPAYSAKYLPTQLIVQLFQIDTNQTLSTLYFVWKNKEEEATQLRLEQKNASVVVIHYSLDDQAPANPNFDPLKPAGTLPQKKKQRQAKSSTTKIIPLPSSSSSAAGKDTTEELLQMRLLAADEVAPRPPTMVEPITIVQEMGRGERNGNGDNEAEADTDEPPYLLCAKLKFIKFGLEYILSLHIPLMDSSPNSSNASSEDMAGTEERNKLNLVGAYLSAKVQV